VVLIDIRRGLLDMDRQLLDWLAHYEIPVVLVATKADKVKQAERIRTLRRIASESEAYGIDRVTMFSAVRGWGKFEIWKVLMSLL
jgi:GTP-binding protein